MSTKLVRIHIESLRDKGETLEAAVKAIKFNDGKENKGEALDEVEALMIALDDLEDILNRDEELGILREELSSANE